MRKPNNNNSIIFRKFSFRKIHLTKIPHSAKYTFPSGDGKVRGAMHEVRGGYSVREHARIGVISETACEAARYCALLAREGELASRHVPSTIHRVK